MLAEKQLKLILALAMFTVAFAVYLATMAPTVSFWDCGELGASAFVLGNPHPPGNPLYFLIGRVFIDLMPFFHPVTTTNILSVASTSLMTMMAFLFTEKAIHIVFEGKISLFNKYCAAMIASFLVTFSDTVWFSAVETETYGTSFLVIMMVSWLALLWYENRNEPKGDRILLLLTYLSFAGMGVNHFSIITLPAVGLFVVFADPKKRTDPLLIITGLALLSVIYAIGAFLWIVPAMLGICFVARLLASSPAWKSRTSFSMLLCIVAILGFSGYLYVPIRSSVNVNIDENEPKTLDTFKEYLERKQYGSEPMIERAFHRRASLQNQILLYPHMGYGGYMLAQYFPWKVGETRADENESVVRKLPFKHEFKTLWMRIGDNPRIQLMLWILFQLPFLYGGYLAYKRNPKVGAFLLVLYGLTSYGLVFYMNFADGSQMELRDYQYWKSTNFNPQAKPENVHIEVRDRDYFFTAGFMFMGTLFGVSAAFLLNWLEKRKKGMAGLPRGVGLALLALAFAVPAYSNWHEHNRRGNYVPWDYAYNLLQSCRPNSVLFTNGDNDTFPLWFMQEVEHVRRDVRVVNLSLVNTDWYIHQLKTHEPKLNIGFTDDEIKQLEPQPWRFKQTVQFKVPNSAIVSELEPRPYMKVQDIMVLHIVQNNYPAHPIHFAVTVGDENMMGLDKYVVMEGMVYTLTEEKRNKDIDAPLTAHLVDSVYQFRGLGDPKLFVDLNTEGLLTNYSATDFRLVMWAQEKLVEIQKQLEGLKKAAGAAPSDSLKAAIAAKEKERDDKIAFAERYLQLNAKILPREWRNNYYGAQLYQAVKDYPKAEAYYRKGIHDAPNPRLFGANLAQLYIEQSKFDQAESLLNDLKDQAPNDFELWYGLSDLYQKRGNLKKAHDVLAEWLRGNPSHQYAAMVSQQIQFLETQMRNPAPAPGAAPADSAAHVAEKTAAKPGEGGIPGLAPVQNGAPKGAAPAPAGKQKDTAMKGTASPSGKKS